MVEISLSGSGEGPGWATAPGYSTAALRGSDKVRCDKFPGGLILSPFQRPIQVDSNRDLHRCDRRRLRTRRFPVATVGDTLSRPEDWCEILNLHATSSTAARRRLPKRAASTS